MSASHWDKESIYDEQIAPLMTKVIAICKEHQIPLVAVFQYQDTEDDGPGYCSTLLPFDCQDEHMRKLHNAATPSKPLMLAETHTISQDGSTSISIRRVT